MKKAVIPAAGLGTRMLPLTKVQPKEMLPLGCKPCIQYIIEELVSIGVNQILIITGQKKRSIEDYFDKDIELNRKLVEADQKEFLEVLSFENNDIQFFYTRQSSPKGLGDALYHAKHFINGEPFILALGDSVIHSSEEEPLLRRMVSHYNQNPNAFIIGTRNVALSDVHKYGIVKPKGEMCSGICEIEDVVEKPSRLLAPSTLAFAARYILQPDIFDALERTSPGHGGELQLTDAIRLLLKEGKKGFAISLTNKEKRYDIGNMSSYYEAFVDFALAIIVFIIVVVIIVVVVLVIIVVSAHTFFELGYDYT
jgi:UTP--glucose-1-phosphate uridylyltransferase